MNGNRINGSLFGLCKGRIASLLFMFATAGLCADTFPSGQDFNLLGEQVIGGPTCYLINAEKLKTKFSVTSVSFCSIPNADES